MAISPVNYGITCHHAYAMDDVIDGIMAIG